MVLIKQGNHANKSISAANRRACGAQARRRKCFARPRERRRAASTSSFCVMPMSIDIACVLISLEKGTPFTYEPPEVLPK